MKLARKLIGLQFDNVFNVYNDWIDSEEHAKLEPRDKNITFSVVREDNKIQFAFKVKVNEQYVTMLSESVGLVTVGSSIELGERVATYGELADILSDVTAEMCYQLMRYAERNDFPSSNIMY